MQNSKLQFKIKNFLPSQTGFTLIELLIVVVIIGVLSSLLTANFITVRQRSRDAQRKADLRQMQSALELYRADQGNYKTQNVVPYQLVTTNCPHSTAVPFTNTGGTVSYMSNVPCDPSGVSVFNASDYYYYSDGTTYTLAACLENSSDTSGTSTAPAPVDASVPSCSSSYYYVVRNP